MEWATVEPQNSTRVLIEPILHSAQELTSPKHNIHSSEKVYLVELGQQPDTANYFRGLNWITWYVNRI